MILYVLLCVTHTSRVFAKDEEPPPIEENGKRYEPILLPVIGGSTDYGVMVGAQAAVARIEPGYKPYRWKGDYTVTMSIKEGPDKLEIPVQFYAVAFNIPGLAGGRLRLSPRAEFRRVSNTGYYGLGNDSPFEIPQEIASDVAAFRRNQFIYMMAKARLNFRIALGRGFNILAGADFRYVMPEIYDDSKLAEDADALDSYGDKLVTGTDDHALIGLTLGVDFDNRDSESNPSCGMFHQIYVHGYPGPVFGLDYPFGSATIYTRLFVPLASEYLVLAMRLRSDLFFGEAPFHDLDLGMIRGISSRRFHGRIKLLGNVEFRSTFFRFTLKKQRFGLGAATFFDSGRVWADYKRNPELDGRSFDVKWGAGGGIRMLWGETRVARIDVAFSPVKAEMNPGFPVGIYFHLNHFF
ncbi:MAG: BamA/TamA family outer membrane protein [Deltaproteobacteria bacterium]|nr:BamA/TamA family outer membrane protein [Deltaproteobacteria bacterium]